MGTNDIVPADRRSLIQSLADEVGLEPTKYYETVKQMCGCKGATDASFAGLLMQARRLGLDPVVRQLYLMDTQRGVQVVIPVDGYLVLMRRHPDYLSHTCEIGADDIGGQYAEATIYTRSQHDAGTPPFRHREYMKECKKGTGPWGSHPLRMLQHKAMSQAVRYAFAIYAPDEDEFAAAQDVGEVKVFDATPAVPIAGLQETEAPQVVDAEVVDAADAPVGEPMGEDDFIAEMGGAAPEAQGGELFS